jgi:HAE1 family hydrophobic/amphiphilic exporter-1
LRAVLALLGATLLALPATAADEPLRLTLAQALDQALGANPEALRAREQVSEFRELVREARAEALPRLDFATRWGRTRDPGLRNSPFFSRLLEGPDALPPEALGAFQFDNYAWSFSLEQPIYTFGRVGAALRGARTELQGVHEDVRSAELLLARDVALAWYDLLLTRRRLAVLESEGESRERQLQQVRDRLELEEATRLELLNAQVALANLRPRVVAAQNATRVALARLNEGLGRPVASPLEPLDGLELPDPLPVVPPPAALAARADAERPELRRFSLSREVLRAAEDVTRSDLKPEIAATAAFGVDTYTTSNLDDLDLHNWSVGVSLRWTLFDGLKTPAFVGLYRSQRRQSELMERSFRAQLGRELEEAHGTWLGAVEAISAGRLAVEGATEAVRVAEESYTWGAATLLDVLEAERARREAELTHAEALHAGQTALASIKYLVGLRPDAPARELAAPPPPTANEENP